MDLGKLDKNEKIKQIDQVANEKSIKKKSGGLSVKSPLGSRSFQRSKRSQKYSDMDIDRDSSKTPTTLNMKAVHIKRSRKQIVQLFKNIYLFYDSTIDRIL